MRAALSTEHSAGPPNDIAAGLPGVIDDGSQYVYGAGLEEMLAGGNTYYYLADGLGSTMAIVDDTGAVQKSYTYDVYGKPTATGTLANEYDFAGQQADSTGLQYLRARYMDPETGRFARRDPLAAFPSWLEHPYNYGDGSPAVLRDATGLFPCPGCSTVRDAAEAAGDAVGDTIDAVGSAAQEVGDALVGAGQKINDFRQGPACVVVAGIACGGYVDLSVSVPAGSDRERSGARLRSTTRSIRIVTGAPPLGLAPRGPQRV